MGIDFVSSNAHYIDFGNVLGLDYDEPWSICCWFKYDQTSTDYFQVIVGKRTGGGAYTGYIFRLMGSVNPANPGGLDVWMAHDGTEPSRLSRYTANDIPSNTWCHIALTHDGGFIASGTLMYINGNLATMVTYGTGDTLKDVADKSILNASNFEIGRSDASGYLNYPLADLCVYTKELSATECKILYEEQGRNPISDNLALRVRLDEGPSGSVATSSTDISKNNYTGVVNNNPIYIEAPLKL